MTIWVCADMADIQSLTENSRYPTYLHHGSFRLFLYTPYLSMLCSEHVCSAVALESVSLFVPIQQYIPYLHAYSILTYR